MVDTEEPRTTPQTVEGADESVTTAPIAECAETLEGKLSSVVYVDDQALPGLLEELLREDIGLALSAQVVERVAGIKSGNAAEFMRCKEVFKARAVWADVNRAIKSRAINDASNVIELYGTAEEQEALVLSCVDDAPVHPMAIVPRGWALRMDSESGKAALCRLVVQKLEGGGKVVVPSSVAQSPIVITSWVKNTTTGRKALEIAWRARGKWHSSVIDREKLMDASKIIEALAPLGFPINSNNRVDVVAYVAAYEARNVALLTVRSVSEQMGWHGDSFIVGNKSIGTNPIGFRGADTGDESLARRFACHGTIEGWREAVKISASYPKVELALYASLVPPLLEPLRASNFAIDWAGGTSQGKTTTLCVAASCWGVPDERDANSLIASWATTDVGIERRSATMSGLPILLDETKRAKSYAGRSIVPEVIYAITNGQGKSRGSKAGLQANRYWRTVLLTNGETPIIDMSRDGGVAARVLTLWGSPFCGHDPRVPNLVRELCANYGHAGPLWVRWVVDNRGACLGKWSARLYELETGYTERLMQLGGGAVTRLASYLAILELCAELAHPVLQLPWEYRSPVGAVVEEIAHQSRSVDRPLEALRCVYSQAVAEQHRFFGRHDDHHSEKLAGKWDPVESWDALYLAKWFLTETLERNGYDLGAITKSWADRGWLDRGDGKHLAKRVRLGSIRDRLWAIPRQAIDKALDLDRD